MTNSGFANLQAELEELLKADENQPTEKRYTVNDITVEKLIELFRENPRGLFYFRDELVGILRSWDKPGRETDRAFFEESWKGYGKSEQERISRGRIAPKGTCLSMFGTIQPGPLASYVDAAVSSGKGDDGLIQRIQLAVYPEMPQTPWENHDEEPDYEVRAQVYRIFEIIDELDPAAHGIEPPKYGTIPALRFEPDAQDFFDEWRTKLENRLRKSDSPVFTAHLGKYRSLMPSLALIFHVADWAAAQDTTVPPPKMGPVTLESAKLAAAWCHFLEEHASKIYAGVINRDIQAAHALAEKIRTGKIRDGAPVRDVYRNQWTALRSREVVYEGLQILRDLNWIRFEERKGAGEFIRINPKLFPRGETA